MSSKTKALSVYVVFGAVVALVVWFSASAVFGAAATDLPAGFYLESVASGFNLPVAARFAPDGRMFVVEKGGVVKIFKDGAVLPTPFITLPNVNDYNDRGLLDLAFDKDFATNNFVYLLYTYENNAADYTGTKTSRLSRVTANGDVAVPGSEVVILGTASAASCADLPAGADCIPSDSPSHSIGSIRVAVDGTLFVSSGDGASFIGADLLALRSQDLDSLGGKIMHINTDGTGIASNPFYTGNPNDNRSKVWAYGFRNPYRFNIKPGTNTLVVGDVGWSAIEEVNVITPGSNYGWPCWEGEAQQGSYQFMGQCQVLYTAGGDIKPLYAYNHPPGAAVVGGTFYTGTEFPVAYQNAFFFSDYGRNEMRTLKLDGTNNLVPGSNQVFSQQIATPVDITMGPDGYLYYVSIYPDEIVRVRYTSDNRAPTALVSADVVGGSVPLTVHFSSAGSFDPDNNALTYHWDFGNGASSEEANSTYVYPAAGVFQATLTVTDVFNATGSASIEIQPGNNQPTVFILTPANGSSAHQGDTVNFSGSASDIEDGVLSGASLEWTVIVHHCPFGTCHNHPLLDATGATGSFVIPDHGSDTYFEIILKATDSQGLFMQKSINVGLVDASNGFVAEYYNTQTPIGTPALTRSDASINFDWGLGSPNPVIPQDHFSARWTRQENFDGGLYEFTVNADDGVHLFIDDVVIIDEWHDQAATAHTIERSITPGLHTIRMEYYENAYAAVAKFAYAKKNICSAKAARIDMSAYTSGDAKWRMKEIDVVPGATYHFSDYSRSDVVTPLIMQVRKMDGSFDYVWLGEAGPSTTWTKNERTFVIPAGAAKIAIFHLIRSTGFLETDAYELYEGSGTTNLISDWSLEVLNPADWAENSWGVNTPSFVYPVEGVVGTDEYCASYFNNINLNGAPSVVRRDAAINFDWGLDTPHNLIQPDRFSTRWVKQADFEDATYQFTVTADDGVRLFIDDVVAIDEWHDQAATTHTATYQTTPGIHTIKLEYYENAYAALVNFDYEKIEACTVRGAKIDMTAYVDGDAKWYHKEISVEAGATYHFADKYKSTVPTRIIAQFRMTDGSFEYAALANISAAADWQDATVMIQAPAGASTVTFFHIVESVGSLTIDRVSVVKNSDAINLIENTSFETPGPASWIKNKWGANTAVFTYPAEGFGECEGVPPPPPPPPAPIVPTNNDGALIFDGVDDYVDIGIWDVEEPQFTFEAEFKAAELGRNADLLAKATGLTDNDYVWSIGVNDQNQFVFRLNTDGVVTKLVGGSFGLNETTHIAARYDGTTMRLYKNGVMVATTPKTGNIAQTSAPVVIGGNPMNHTARAFKGTLEDMRVWNIVRTDAGIVATLGQPLVGPQIGLIKYWKFNENFGQDIIDRSNSGHHGRFGSAVGVDINDPAWSLGGSAAPTTDFVPTHISTIVTGASGARDIDVTLQNTGTQPGHAVLDFEVYDAGGVQVFQKFYNGETLQAGESRSFNYEFTPPGPGTYRVAVGVIKLNWTGLYQWVNSAASITQL
ncbi:MAG: PKD domain-containing protein [Candidatus Ryanbacteria bacterium]|nr:PKD domain-containing protein [Candidatus Ryanbacteria bacterium]